MDPNLQGLPDFPCRALGVGEATGCRGRPRAVRRASEPWLRPSREVKGGDAAGTLEACGHTVGAHEAAVLTVRGPTLCPSTRPSRVRLCARKCSPSSLGAVSFLVTVSPGYLCSLPARRGVRLSRSWSVHSRGHAGRAVRHLPARGCTCV